MSRYREQAARGATFPPVKVARMPTGALALVGGWHRMEAGALTADHGLEGQQVLAEVADMDEAQARWEAAKAIAYVARNLEPYCGFHQFMRALSAIQKEHKTCHTVFVGGDDVSFGRKPEGAKNWREKMLQEVGSQLDPTRTHFLGKVAATRSGPVRAGPPSSMNTAV